jgi:hypothetical protein
MLGSRRGCQSEQGRNQLDGLHGWTTLTPIVSHVFNRCLGVVTHNNNAFHAMRNAHLNVLERLDSFNDDRKFRIFLFAMS